MSSLTYEYRFWNEAVFNGLYAHILISLESDKSNWNYDMETRFVKIDV